MNLTLFKLIINFVKYYVFTASIVMTIHCGLLLSGIDLWYTDLLFGLSLGGFIAIFITSYVLKMCNLFRLFLVHLFLVSSCISYEDNIGFGDALFPMRCFMFMFGIILIMKLIELNGFKEDCSPIFKGICG